MLKLNYKGLASQNENTPALKILIFDKCLKLICLSGKCDYIENTRIPTSAFRPSHHSPRPYQPHSYKPPAVLYLLVYFGNNLSTVAVAWVHLYPGHSKRFHLTSEFCKTWDILKLEDLTEVVDTLLLSRVIGLQSNEVKEYSLYLQKLYKWSRGSDAYWSVMSIRVQ